MNISTHTPARCQGSAACDSCSADEDWRWPEAAITQSDNAAAEALCARLGDPTTAAGKVETVLRDAGDHTPVEATKVRPEFSSFGRNPVAFARSGQLHRGGGLRCTNGPTFDLIGQIAGGQRWGIGTLLTQSSKAGGDRPCPGDTLCAGSASSLL